MLDGTWESSRHLVGLQGGHAADEPLQRGDPRGRGRRRRTRPQAGIVDGSAPVFAGPIKDQAGDRERVAAGATLDDAGLLKMDWYVEGVQG